MSHRSTTDNRFRPMFGPARMLAVLAAICAAVALAGCDTSSPTIDTSGSDTVNVTPGDNTTSGAEPESAFAVAAGEAADGSILANDEVASSVDETPTANAGSSAEEPTSATSAQASNTGDLTGELVEEPFDKTVVTIGELRADGWYVTTPELPEDHGDLIVRPRMEPFATGDYRYQFLEAMPENGAYGDAIPYTAALFQDVDRVWTPVTGVSDRDLQLLLEPYLEPGQVLRPPDILEANEIGEHLVGLRLQVPVHDFLSGAKVQDIEVNCSMNAGRAPSCTPEDILESTNSGPGLSGEDGGVVTRLCSYYDPEADPDLFADPSLDAEKKREIGGPDCALLVAEAGVEVPDGWVHVEYKTDAETVEGWVQRETVGTRREMIENYRAIREQSPGPSLNPNETMLDTLSVLDYAVLGVELPADFGNVSDQARQCLREVWETRAEVLVDTGTISASGCNLLGDVTGECKRVLRFPDGGLADVTIVYTADNPDYPITHAGIDEVRFGGIPTSPECAIGGA